MLFSIIVANYNNGAFLDDLVLSIESQTYNNWELIIVDDASTDNSCEILKRYLNKDRIRIFFHETNRGAAASFHTAAANTTGDIIGMLGADDALCENALAEMILKHEEFPTAALICSNLYRCDEKLNILSTWDKYEQPLAQGSLIKEITVGSFATFKTSIYRMTTGFDAAFKKALDHDMFLKLEERGDVKYHNKPLYLYRSNPLGISQNDNWLEALQFSTIARKNAYWRRKKTDLIINLSRREYLVMMKQWSLRQSKLLYSRGKYMEAFIYAFKSYVFYLF